MNALVRVYAYACVCTIEQPTLGVTRSLAEQVAAMQEVIDQGHYPQDSRIAAHTRRVRRIVDSLTTRIQFTGCSLTTTKTTSRWTMTTMMMMMMMMMPRTVRVVVLNLINGLTAPKPTYATLFQRSDAEGTGHLVRMLRINGCRPGLPPCPFKIRTDSADAGVVQCSVV